MGKNKDIFGEAAKAFYYDQDETDIIVESPDFDDDLISVQYLFRNFEEMPIIEQVALDNCHGKVLDVGCSVGSHSLWLQDQGLDVTGIDLSEGSVEIAQERGTKKVKVQDFYNLETEKFDTLLFLMNGSGIIGSLENIPKFFEQSRKLLNQNGKILMDSSDLIFLFDEKPDPAEGYYGELEFRIKYKDQSSESFPWLYIDPELLYEMAQKHRFNCEILKKGPHFDYLAELKPF